jgi:hypothetical protein
LVISLAKAEDGRMIARIALYVIVTLLIAAHFLRVGNVIAVALCLAAPLLFLVRQGWSLLLLQWLAYVAAVVWLATAWQIVATRWSSGEPWLRAAAILVAVAAINVLAGSLLRSRTMRVHYRDR